MFQVVVEGSNTIGLFSEKHGEHMNTDDIKYYICYHCLRQLSIIHTDRCDHVILMNTLILIS